MERHLWRVAVEIHEWGKKIKQGIERLPSSCRDKNDHTTAITGGRSRHLGRVEKPADLSRRPKWCKPGDCAVKTRWYVALIFSSTAEPINHWDVPAIYSRLRRCLLLLIESSQLYVRDTRDSVLSYIIRFQRTVVSDQTITTGRVSLPNLALK